MSNKNVSWLLVLIGALAAGSPAFGEPGRGKGNGNSGGGGRTENAPGMVIVGTDTSGPGLFSDTGNVRYYGLGLDDITDPEDGTQFLDDGDCVTVVTPSDDGVDRGRLVFFAPFGLNDCPDPGLLRQLKVVGSGQDLDGVGGVGDELIDTRFGCDDVFPNDSPIPGGVTLTSCSLEVRQYDASGEFERTWIIEWPTVNVTHLAVDRRRLEAANDAEIFELVASAKGNGKKDKVSRGFTWLAFSFDIVRLRSP